MFLYFVETTRPALTEEHLRGVGLGYALGDNSFEYRTTTNGPGGKGGVIISISAPGAVPTKFDAKSQTWRKGGTGTIDGKDVTWFVGLNNGAKPGPKELARAKQIAGEAVELRDGNMWTIPRARSIVRGSTLPKELVLGEDNETWTEANLPEFASLCADAEQVMKWFFEGHTDEEGNPTGGIPYKDGMRVAVAAMAVNYRVSKLEVAMLRLFADVTMARVLEALCDLLEYSRVLEARKKNDSASETSHTNSGREASSVDTSQPSAT